ncbi:hypothetical protein J3R30DRAFT_3403187 [Lentinula aciculospora]|uniref:Glycan binding protein Y3-like domain-containing protein n=1 Tax=Lentinula aciculospora TaxID=153920 RepID=A0A9W9DQ34_9AGAR|nr:hypothetical protein J3R30DRAFT_3403187 [Lentinula aciculospora]
MQLSQVDYRKLNIAALVLMLNTACAVGQDFSTNCFATGIEGGCGSFIDTFCETGSAISVVAPQDTASHCFNAPGLGFHCDFTSFNIVGSTSVNSDTANCEIVLGAIAEDCPMGGRGSFVGGAFQFSLDPNEGACASDPGSNQD